MAYQLRLPKFGMAMESAKVLEWKKDVGDRIEKEEVVLIAENEKLTSDIVSMESGVLLEKVAQVGEKYLVGDLLAYLGEPGEATAGGTAGQAPQALVASAAAPAASAVASAPAAPAAGASSAGSGERVKASPLAKKIAAELGVDLALVTGSGSGGRIEKADVEQFAEASKSAPTAAASSSDSGERVKASPLAKKVAAELGVNLALVTGSGSGGRIEKADVEQFAEAAAPAPSAAAQAPLDLPQQPAYTEIPYTGIRQAVGANMLRAWTTIPMVTHHVKADAGAILAVREALNDGVEDRDSRVSVNDLLMKLTAVALTQMPALNASLTGDVIRVYKDVHLGMATALDNGLIVPVIRNADQKSLLQISKEAKDLAAKARSGNLLPDDVGGGTFTVTNLGGFGSVDEFTPIINPPEAAILGIGRAVDTPVVVDGEICIRPMIALSLTYDHRVLDGAVAAAFIKILMDLMAKPLRVFCA
ncbi:MAG: 2-oxo acid dehydrogenase subunit E2 [Clostridiales bacterium]|nr:2-oxo acid dehydrogenase subunit E2 [Clostridiales bacterium]